MMAAKRWPPGTAAQYRREAMSLLGEDLAARFNAVRALVFDADGVLTPGNLIYGPTGEALKEFSSHDGLGIVMARVVNLKLAVLTGRQSQIVGLRASELGFDAIRLGRYDKLAALAEILQELACAAQETLYVGDDMVDLPVLLEVGVPVAVPAAPQEVQRHCLYVTNAAGGQGAVREVIDLVLKCRGLYSVALKRLARQTRQRPAGGSR